MKINLTFKTTNKFTYARIDANSNPIISTRSDKELRIGTIDYLSEVKCNKLIQLSHNKKIYEHHIYNLFETDPVHELCKLSGLPMPQPDT